MSAPPPAVGDDAAVEAMQRIADHWRVDYLFDGHRLGQQRVRVVLRVNRRGHLDLGELLARGAKLIHVSPSGKRVQAVNRRSERRFEGILRGSETIHHEIAHHLSGQACQRDERDRGLACLNRCGRMADVGNIGRAAGFGRVGVAQLQTHVVRHGNSAETWRVPRAEVCVDVGEAQSRVPEGACGDLRVHLAKRLVRYDALWMLVRTCDERGSANTHFLPFVVLRDLRARSVGTHPVSRDASDRTTGSPNRFGLNPAVQLYARLRFGGSRSLFISWSITLP